MFTKPLVWLRSAKASNNIIRTPFWLNRQKRFDMLFQLPNSAGKARHVMLSSVK